MVLFGKHGSLNRMFKKAKKWGGGMFKKVKGGLSKAKVLLDNPIVHAIAEHAGLGDLHTKAMGLLDTANHHVGRAEGLFHHGVRHIENVGNKIHTLGQTVKGHAAAAKTGARGLATDHTETALGQYTHDLAHMAHDSLQKAKAVKEAAQPLITFH